MSEIRRPPLVLSEMHQAQYRADPVRRKSSPSPSGMPWQKGWTWRCEVCGYEWVPPGEDPTAIAPE
jgi:hypothetical protein